MTTKRKARNRGDDLRWTRNPARYPSFRTVSPGMGFYRRVLVYRGAPTNLEFMSVKMPPLSDFDAHNEAFVAVTDWNLQWEGGPYRNVRRALPAPLGFLHSMEAGQGEAPSSDIVLLPQLNDDIYEKWAPLYHLLPRSTLLRFELPVAGRGCWPIRGGLWDAPALTTAHSDALARAFAAHLWKHGVAITASPLAAFDAREPLVLLGHDLAFWRGPLERIVRARCVGAGRVKKRSDDPDPESMPKLHDVSYEMPTFGIDVWSGEEEASEATYDLIDQADENGKLRALIDAIRSNRVEEDFSAAWSWAREDFERKLYRKRSKVRVRFVELGDSTPFYDENAELHGNLLFRDLLSVVQPRDRSIVVCLHKGMTNLRDIATTLGYANHSPISKALARIRARAEKLLGD